MITHVTAHINGVIPTLERINDELWAIRVSGDAIRGVDLLGSPNDVKGWCDSLMAALIDATAQHYLALAEQAATERQAGEAIIDGRDAVYVAFMERS